MNSEQFNRKALELFRFQWKYNVVYRNYCDLINCRPEEVNTLHQIPFLPISFFKDQAVKTTEFKEELIFESSGTTQMVPSRHYVKELGIYQQSFTTAFESFYGQIDSYCVLGLLPAYLERSGSSLIYMVNEFIQKSGHPSSGFFLHNQEELSNLLDKLAAQNQKTLLIGVSFALLDLIEDFPIQQHPSLIVMETGGMKGRRKELIRTEMHEILKKGFHQENVHSEYGMTELLSQAYSTHDGLFQCPPWMKVLIRKQDDPFSYCEFNESGGINIIDLANVYSCAFIQTDDLGKLHPNNQFEVLGRFDAAEVRGCNLLVAAD